MRLLLIDDSLDTGEIVCRCLQPHDVHQVFTIAEAKKELFGQSFDLLIIDHFLPDGSGLDYCAELNSQIGDIPKLILSADNEVKSIVYGLASGAVDYISKPFRAAELKARVELHLKRGLEIEKKTHRFEQFEFSQNYFDCYYVNNKAERVHLSLTPKELHLLLILLQSKGEVVAKEDLIRQVWKNHGLNIALRGLDAHITNLRKKISPFGFSIACTWGRGYSYKKSA